MASSALAGTLGADSQGVKRPTAPVVKAVAKASLAKARAALGTDESTELALKALDDDVYAKSSVTPRDGRWRVINLLAAGASRPFAPLPLTRQKLRLLAAALKAGSYRSAKEYLLVAKKMHLVCGGDWSEALRTAMADVTRSVTRGLGPAKQAVTFDLKEIAERSRQSRHLVVDGPRCPEATGICMALWLLRGLEAASVLGEQATVSADRALASLDLGPTKEDPQGRGCPRTLACACSSPDVHGSGPSLYCPVAALEDVLRDRQTMGLSGKSPLFVGKHGLATTAAGVKATYSRLLSRCIGEHSFRRSGAKFYALQNVSENHIMFLGRWGSARVRLYIGEAMAEQAMRAAQRATLAAGNPMAPRNLGPSALVTTTELLQQATVTRAVDESAAAELVAKAAVAARTAVEQAMGDIELRCAEFAASRIGAVRPAGRADQGLAHLVAVGDGCLPSELWVTRCGWSFGLSRHIRVHKADVTCEKCIAWA